MYHTLHEMILTHPFAINKKGCVFVSAEIKVTFLQELERVLSTRTTAADLPVVLASVSDVLEHYDFSRVNRQDVPCSLDLLDTWLSAMKVQGRSPKTIEAYSYLINRLVRDLQIPIREITVYHLRSWLTKEKERGISDGTLEGNRQVFSSMFGWLWREGLIDKNPVSNIGTIKSPKKVREPYADVDIEQLKAACSSPRNMAILSFLLATGCRISEVTGLNRDDINFADKEVIVLGKGNKERTVFFDDVTALHLHRYLATRTDDNPALFIGKRKERLLPGGVRIMLKTLAAAAGVEHVHPHKFRRTLATMLIAHGMPIQEVAAILGHEKLDTTMRYIRLDKSSVKNSYKRYA